MEDKAFNQKDGNFVSLGYKNIHNHVKQYACTLLHQAGVTIGVVSHIYDYDIKNEFDPLMIERIKNC